MIDSNGATAFTHFIPENMTWPDQWRLALERLELLRRAEIVYTRRLHVAIPCLAFGTPVVLYRFFAKQALRPERFSLVDALGIEWNRPCTLDLTPHAERYCEFLSRALGRDIRPGGPVFPEPISD